MCIVYPNEIVHYDTGCICMFGINPISRFIQYGHNKNSKSILISHDITSENRRRFERKRKEKKKTKNKRELIGLLTRKPERINKNEEN